MDIGDAIDAKNSLRFGFQRGFIRPTGEFTAYTTVCAPYPPGNSQSVGLFIGPGDQDNYVKAVVDRSGGTPAMHDSREVDGVGAGIAMKKDAKIGNAPCVDIRILVTPATRKYAPSYSLNGGTSWTGFGGDAKRRTIPAAWLDSGRPLAVGLFSTRVNGSLPSFGASWDRLGVVVGRTVPPR